MRILVTGYKGFIGQNLVEALCKDPHNEVFTYHWGEEWPTWDLDWVIHLGAISSTTEGNVEKILTQNYEFTMELLHRCEENDVNIQYASSGSVYGLGRDFRETAGR
jgi:ADP-L-glycero-D-manno-heptose 6-epimerase